MSLYKALLIWFGMFILTGTILGVGIGVGANLNKNSDQSGNEEMLKHYRVKLTSCIKRI